MTDHLENIKKQQLVAEYAELESLAFASIDFAQSFLERHIRANRKLSILAVEKYERLALTIQAALTIEWELTNDRR